MDRTIRDALVGWIESFKVIWLNGRDRPRLFRFLVGVCPNDGRHRLCDVAGCSRVSDGADRDQGNLSPGRSMLPSGLSVTPPGLLTVTTSAPARSTISISVFSYVSFIRSFPFHFAGLGWSMVIGACRAGGRWLACWLSIPPYQAQVAVMH